MHLSPRSLMGLLIASAAFAPLVSSDQSSEDGQGESQTGDLAGAGNSSSFPGAYDPAAGTQGFDASLTMGGGTTEAGVNYSMYELATGFFFAGTNNLYYNGPFTWGLVYNNTNDDRKIPESGIPVGQDGNCNKSDGQAVPSKALQGLIPKIQQNAAKKGGLVGNEDTKGCTRLFGAGAARITYCGVGNATFDNFNTSMQILMGNCSSIFGDTVQGRVYLWGSDHTKQNWLQVTVPPGEHLEATSEGEGVDNESNEEESDSD